MSMVSSFWNSCSPPIFSPNYLRILSTNTLIKPSSTKCILNWSGVWSVYCCCCCFLLVVFCCVKLKTSVLHSSSSLCAVVGTNLSIPCGRITPSSTAGLHQRAAPSLSSFCSCTEPLPRAQSAQTFTYFPLQGFISRGWVTFPFKLKTQNIWFLHCF